MNKGCYRGRGWSEGQFREKSKLSSWVFHDAVRTTKMVKLKSLKTQVLED